MESQKSGWLTNSFPEDLKALPDGKGYSSFGISFPNFVMGAPQDTSNIVISDRHERQQDGQLKLIPTQRGLTQQQLEENGIVGIYKLG